MEGGEERALCATGVEEEGEGAPERPEESDCCGSGCDPCVFDVYAARLAEWERSRLDVPTDPASRPASVRPYLSDTRYRAFTVAGVEEPARNARLLTFRASGPGPLGLGPGQHLFMRGGDHLSRAYTPVWHRLSEFGMIARLYPDGPMSSYLATLSQGDEALFRGPYGGPGPYRRNRYRRVLMLCAGTGLAPMVSTATSIVEDDLDETFVRLLYCERSVADILLRERLLSLAQHWNFTVRIHLTSSEGGGAKWGEDLRYARLDRRALADELGANTDTTLVMVCGTKSFDADMAEHVLALGVDKGNVHVF